MNVLSVAHIVPNRKWLVQNVALFILDEKEAHDLQITEKSLCLFFSGVSQH
jgi:hypothetical protein